MSIPLDYMHDNWVYYANYSELGSISVTPSVVIPEGGVGELTIRYDFKKQDYFTGYQFYLRLPEGISYTSQYPQYLLGECHGSSHWLNYSNRTYYCSSETNETLHGSSGTLLKLLIKAGESLHSGDVLLGYFLDPRLSTASYTEGYYLGSNGYAYSVYDHPSVPFTIIISDPDSTSNNLINIYNGGAEVKKDNYYMYKESAILQNVGTFTVMGEATFDNGVCTAMVLTFVYPSKSIAKQVWNNYLDDPEMADELPYYSYDGDKVIIYRYDEETIEGLSYMGKDAVCNLVKTTVQSIISNL